jgi:SAM-dependent methyltransferase
MTGVQLSRYTPLTKNGVLPRGRKFATATVEMLLGRSKEKLFPRSIKAVKRKVSFFLEDVLDCLLGRRDELTPPKRKIFVGGREDYKRIGEEFLRYFIELGGLGPDERVLDVGCGIGRMAVPLTKYLNERGCYEGFDIVPDGINWCRKKITPRYPNFRFQLADIFNKKYNPRGRYRASEYHFPYESESFDFVFLTSVFTHMLPDDMEHYFSEISRVIKRSGRCLVTFFLWNEEALRLIDAGKSIYDFKYEGKGFRTIHRDTPESAVAYDERFIRGMYEKFRFTIRKPIHFGSWCGREHALAYQDVVIAAKE